MVRVRNPMRGSCHTPVTIKAEPGRRVRFLGIRRRVEVGERSSVIVTIKSAPADLPGNGVEFLARLSAGVRKALVRCLPVSLRYTCGIQQGAAHSYRPYDVRQAIAHIGRAPGQIWDNPDNVDRSSPKTALYLLKCKKMIH